MLMAMMGGWKSARCNSYKEEEEKEGNDSYKSPRKSKEGNGHRKSPWKK